MDAEDGGGDITMVGGFFFVFVFVFVLILAKIDEFFFFRYRFFNSFLIRY